MSERLRSWVIKSVLVYAVCGLIAAGPAFGQVAARPVIAEGEVTANDVYVRSGDSLNHYTVCKLAAGNRVSIVSERGEWYEVLPPSEAFSLISGDYVDSVDGAHGVVNGNNVRVRTGSVLNDNKYTVQLLLSKGNAVRILGKNPDGFLKIAPPVGATVWVHQSFVEKIPESRSQLEAQTRTGDFQSPTAPIGSPATTDTGQADWAGGEAARAGAASTGRDSVVTKSETLARLDKTPQRDELARIDAGINSELAKPVLERRLEPFLQRYQAIARQGKDVVAQNYAQARATQVEDMIALIDTVRQMRRLEEDAALKRRGFQEGRAGIRTVSPSEPIGFDAKGVLRRSALYPKGGTLERYRLVDASTPDERIIGYIEVPGNSPVQAEALLGQFVGVRASAKRWQQDSVQPVPIYVVQELVALEQPARPEVSAVGR